MKLRFSRRADTDVDRIEAWLAAIDADLATEALIAIRQRVAILRQHPAIGSPIAGGRRKLIERRFGHVILYRIGTGTITILRIRHEREDWG